MACSSLRDPYYAIPTLLGVVMCVISWSLHRKYETLRLGKAERKATRYVCFPEAHDS